MKLKREKEGVQYFFCQMCHWGISIYTNGCK